MFEFQLNFIKIGYTPLELLINKINDQNFKNGFLMIKEFLKRKNQGANIIKLLELVCKNQCLSPEVRKTSIFVWILFSKAHNF